MVRSASKIAEPEADGEAQAKLRRASLQFETETAVDASPEGQPGETTRSVTSGAKEEIDADGIDDLKLGAPPPWPALSPMHLRPALVWPPASEVSTSTRPYRGQVA